MDAGDVVSALTMLQNDKGSVRVMRILMINNKCILIKYLGKTGNIEDYKINFGG